MITVVTSSWKQEGWHKYSPQDVYNLYHKINKNTTLPFRFVCVTNEDLDLETIPLPNLGYSSKSWGNQWPQCFNRLWFFSQGFRKYVGDRFINIDLDCEVFGNIDHILSRKEDFVINKGNKKRNGYSGSMWLLPLGIRSIYPTQNLVNKATRKYLGSDQAVIRYCYPNEAMFNEEEDGIYHYNYWKKGYLPDNCKIMFYAGREKLKNGELLTY